MSTKESRNRKWRVFLAGLLAVLLLFTVACGKNQREEEIPELLVPVGVSIDTETVKYGDLINYVTYEGVVRAGVTELYFEVDGTVEEILVYPGQYVEEGDVLLTLDHESIENSIKTLEKNIGDLTRNGEFEDRIADLNLQLLQIDLQEIAERSGTEAKEYQLKQLDIEEAVLLKDQKKEVRERDLKALEDQLTVLKSQTEAQIMKAPHAGYVYFSGSLQEGAMVRAYRTVMNVVNSGDLTFVVEGNVESRILDAESTYAWIGAEAWKLEYQPLSAEERYEYIKKEQIPPTFFKIKANEKSELPQAGSSGVLIGEQAHFYDVLTVPVNALFAETSQYYVYVVNNGSRSRRDVKVGQTNHLRRIITEGLEEGEVVYVAE